MIIGVKPLGHFQRCDAVISASHAEIRAMIDRSTTMTEARWHGANHATGIKDMIIKGEVVAWHHRDAVVFLS